MRTWNRNISDYVYVTKIRFSLWKYVEKLWVAEGVYNIIIKEKP